MINLTALTEAVKNLADTKAAYNQLKADHTAAQVAVDALVASLVDPVPAPAPVIAPVPVAVVDAAFVAAIPMTHATLPTATYLPGDPRAPKASA